jgi:hypothetical protein
MVHQSKRLMNYHITIWKKGSSSKESFRSIEYQTELIGITHQEDARKIGKTNRNK